MTRRVEMFPPNFARANQATTTMKNTIRAALPVRGADHWRQMGAMANWLRGRGATLVSANGTNVNITAGSSSTYLYRVWPRYECPTRIWIVTLTTKTLGAYGTVTVSEPPTPTANFTITTANRPREVVIIQPFQEVEAPADVPQQASVVIANNALSDADVYVQSIACHEIPAFELPDGYGAELASLGLKSPIYEDATRNDDLSVEAVARHARYAKQVARKAHQFSYYYPTGVTITSGSATALFPSAMLQFACPRLLEAGNTSRNLVWNAYAKVTGGSATGEVALSSNAGSSIIAVTSTSATWHADHTLSVRCEDPTRWATDGGIRTGTRDFIQVAARQTGATSVTVYGVCVAEADNDPLTVLGSP